MIGPLLLQFKFQTSLTAFQCKDGNSRPVPRWDGNVGGDRRIVAITKSAYRLPDVQNRIHLRPPRSQEKFEIIGVRVSRDNVRYPYQKHTLAAQLLLNNIKTRPSHRVGHEHALLAYAIYHLVVPSIGDNLTTGDPTLEV